MIRKAMVAIGLSLALAFAGSFALAQSKAASQADKSFMKKAMQGDMAEMKMGQLAQQNGQSAKVKEFGKTLVQDHSANLDKAKSVAQSMNVQPPSAPSAKQKAVYDKLSKLNGAAFDKKFAQAMVSDHKKDISEFERESKKSGKAADFAKQTLPTLKKHLRIAESLKPGTTGSK
jgi:putative membrane protein